MLVMSVTLVKYISQWHNKDRATGTSAPDTNLGGKGGWKKMAVTATAPGHNYIVMPSISHSFLAH